MRAQADALFNLATDLCLNQHITTPIRGKNILDIVMTNDDKLIHDYTVEKTNLSDHKVVNLQTNITKDEHLNKKSPHWKQNSVLINFNFFTESVSWKKMKSDLGEVDWYQLMQDSDPETQYNLILTRCLQISCRHVPPRRIVNKQCIPRDRKILMRKRTKLRKKNETHYKRIK